MVPRPFYTFELRVFSLRSKRFQFYGLKVQDLKFPNSGFLVKDPALPKRPFSTYKRKALVSISSLGSMLWSSECAGLSVLWAQVEVSDCGAQGKGLLELMGF